jgi:hypothetical protein
MGILHEDLRVCTFMVVSRCILLRIRNLTHKICIENQNTHFITDTFFPQIVPFMRYVQKYGTARQATDNNAPSHAPDTLIIFNTHCFKND